MNSPPVHPLIVAVKSAAPTVGKITLLFAVVKSLLLWALRRYGPAEFVNGAPVRQRRTLLYIFSCVNSMVCCAPFLANAGRMLRERWVIADPYTSIDRNTGACRNRHLTEPAERKTFEWSRLAICTITGYLLHDLLSILPEAAKYPADMAHHLFGVACGVVTMHNLPVCYPFVPLAMFAEASTLPLNAMWFMREYPAATLKVVSAVVGPARAEAAVRVIRDRVVPYTFAGIFAAVRALLITVMYCRVFRAPVKKVITASTQPGAEADGADATKPARVENSSVVRECMGSTFGVGALGFMVAIQLYWFALIMRKMVTSTR